jgi:ribosomal protein S18 acetylase RimI-like enzyme
VTDLTIFVRPATVGDDDVIRKHRQMSEQESTQYRGSISTTKTTPMSRLTFVAGLGATVMGSLVATQSSDKTWTIESVFVETACRDIGIGDALVVTCLGELHVAKATWVESHALPGDRATKNLFERHGLVAQTITVGKSL